eukprot:1359566-Amphidinium_carterae.1
MSWTELQSTLPSFVRVRRFAQLRTQFNAVVMRLRPPSKVKPLSPLDVAALPITDCWPGLAGFRFTKFLGYVLVAQVISMASLRTYHELGRHWRSTGSWR